MEREGGGGRWRKGEKGGGRGRGRGRQEDKMSQQLAHGVRMAGEMF